MDEGVNLLYLVGAALRERFGQQLRDCDNRDDSIGLAARDARDNLFRQVGVPVDPLQVIDQYDAVETYLDGAFELCGES